ncbi:diguanylate cyclase [Acidaminobacter sp. JC074]|uniref:sensor domain-containing diguanylate cyclase n=1 Tax=Acidaminobacter sp. JC074 TaxID=2530199 RepID=UPI001F10E731|nr:sensor domain-containing diguanylate cyclase [Acidaminobacter sp. JC074]MCH4886331.1 diguanylate cyclase [Acidaminobacter sp. JC074]
MGTLDKKLNRAEEKFRILFENSPIGMAMVIHETGAFVEVNPSLLQSTGYTREEFLKLSFWDITPREYEQQELEQIEEINKTGKFGPNYKEYIRKDGSRFPIKISGFKLTEVDGREVVWGLIEDISENKRLEEELRYLATCDPLTQLLNRRTLNERFDLCVEFCKREAIEMAIITIDLDKFKDVNDSYGHHVGDEVLIEIAKRLQSNAKRKIDTVARLGGDEFMMILADISIHSMDNIAKRILDDIKRPIESDDYCVEISASIGVAVYPGHGSEQEVLMKLSDKAAYDVKRNGGNGYRIYGVYDNE